MGEWSTVGLAGAVCFSLFSFLFSLFSCESSAVSVGPLRGGPLGPLAGALWPCGPMRAYERAARERKKGRKGGCMKGGERRNKRRDNRQRGKPVGRGTKE